jgi:hypothetical protein
VQGATPTGCSSWPRNSAVRLANSGSYMPIGIYTRHARKLCLVDVTGFHQGPPFLVTSSLTRGQHIGGQRRTRARIALFHQRHSEHFDPCINQVVRCAATHLVADRASAIGLNIRQPLSGLRSLTWPTRVGFQQTAPPLKQSANLAAQPNPEFWLLNLYRNLRHDPNWMLVKQHLFYKKAPRSYKYHISAIRLNGSTHISSVGPLRKKNKGASSIQISLGCNCLHYYGPFCVLDHALKDF